MTALGADRPLGRPRRARRLRRGGPERSCMASPRERRLISYASSGCRGGSGRRRRILATPRGVSKIRAFAPCPGRVMELLARCVVTGSLRCRVEAAAGWFALFGAFRMPGRRVLPPVRWNIGPVSTDLMFHRCGCCPRPRRIGPCGHMMTERSITVAMGPPRSKLATCRTRFLPCERARC